MPGNLAGNSQIIDSITGRLWRHRIYLQEVLGVVSIGMDIIGLVVVIVLAIGLAELIFNILFKKDSSDREFTSILFSPKYLAAGGYG